MSEQARRLDGLGALRASEAALGSQLLVQARLADADDPRPAPPDGRSLLARAVGLALAGRRVGALAAGPLDATSALAAAVGKRLPLVLHLLGRGHPRAGVAAGAGHDELSALATSGAFQLVARDPQDAADLTLVAHRLAELALTPGVLLQDAHVTGAGCHSVVLPELATHTAEFGGERDRVGSASAAQVALYGAERRRVPRGVDPARPLASGGMLDPPAAARALASQAVWFDESLPDLADRAFSDVTTLTGRRLSRVRAHRVEDSKYVLVTSGSLAGLAVAVADHLRQTRKLAVGVLQVLMPWPFPSDLLAAWLRGRKAVAVLERQVAHDAGDPPLLCALRAALGLALENGRTKRTRPHPRIDSCRPDDLPALFGVACGLGGVQPTPGDLVAAVEHICRRDDPRRRVVLGVDFVHADTQVPKLQLWQQQLLDAVPDLAERALAPAADVELLGDADLSVRVHAVGHAAPRHQDQRLLDDLASLLDLTPQLWPDPTPERLGLPRTSAGLLTPSGSPLLAPPERARLVLACRPHGASTEALLTGLAPGATLLLEDERSAPSLWRELPRRMQRAAREGLLRLASVDATSPLATGDGLDAATSNGTPDTEPTPPADASERTSAPQRHGILLGACLALSCRVLGREPPPDEHLLRWATRAAQSAGVDAEPLHAAISRGLHSVRDVEPGAEQGPELGSLPRPPQAVVADDSQHPGHAGRFWERVGHLVSTGARPLADPLAALAQLPAASSRMRALSNTRTQLPQLDTQRCSGCGDCWLQCPDGAWQARAAGPEAWLRTALEQAAAREPMERLTQLAGPLARQVSRALRKDPTQPIGAALGLAWEALRDKLELDEAQRVELQGQFERLSASLGEHPLVTTQRLFRDAESQVKGSGTLLSLSLDTSACKACEICVEVCPEDALSSVFQDPDALAAHARALALAGELPDDFVPDLGADAASLQLRRSHAEALRGGDEACAGCGEKTAMRQVLAVLGAEQQPRLSAYCAQLDELIEGLTRQARELVSGDIDLAAVSRGGAPLALPPEHDAALQTLADAVARLQTVRDRVDGELSRTTASVVGSAGCSLRWGASWPHTPYAVPFVAHGLEHGPAVALGLYEGQLAELADDFASVRRGQALLAGERPDDTPLDWRRLTDAELRLCPPVLLVGGDGALGEAGQAQLGALLSSARPLRVVVLDNQIGSDCGGRPGRASYVTGRPDDGLAARSELALLALTQRQAFVAQTSPAFPEHLLGAVRRGLASQHPALFVVYAACPLEHGVASRRAVQAARLATTSRAFPLLVHDPDGGAHLADRLELDGNPQPETDWVRAPDGGALSVAHWAVTEERFAEYLSPLSPDDAGRSRPLLQWLATPEAERGASLPCVPGPGGTELVVSPALARLTEERASLWNLLRELAGQRPTEALRETLTAELSDDFSRRAEQQRDALQRELDETREKLPSLVARRLAEGLLRSGSSNQTLGELLHEALGGVAVVPDDLSALAPAPEPVDGQDSTSAVETAVDATAESSAEATPGATATVDAPAAESDVAVAPAEPQVDEDDDDEDLVMDPYIQSIRCTSCNECTNINGRLFVYNKKQQAEIGDPDAGSFAQLVQAAEKCPVAIIHPGTPRNPDEKDLDSWVQRAARFR